MTYIYTPEEAKSIANVIANFLVKRKHKVSVEVALRGDASFRTTLLAKKGALSILVEAQHKPRCDDSLIKLARLLDSENSYSEFYVATHESANFTGTFLKQLDTEGIGLVVVGLDGGVTVIREPKNPALIVRPDPTLKYGKYREQVDTCVANFNAPNSSFTQRNLRKEALGEMCDIVERLTKDVGLLASKKGLLKLSEGDMAKKDWNGTIDTLAAKNLYVQGEVPIVSGSFRYDLHSFRGARNLLKHPAPSKQVEDKRQKQFAERMMMGPRLVADLVSVRTGVGKRKRLRT